MSTTDQPDAPVQSVLLTEPPIADGHRARAEHPHRARRALAVFLLVLSAVLVPVSVVAVWARNAVLDTDSYVATVAPLAHNPQIQQRVATVASDGILGAVDLESRVAAFLPAQAQPLVPAVAGAVRSQVERLALAFTQSDAFPVVWEKVNRAAHQQIRKVLLDEGTLVRTDGGKVMLDLQPVIDAVNARLAESRFTFLQDVRVNPGTTQIELFDAPNLAAAQQAARALNVLRWVLPVLVLGLLAAGLGVYPASRRRAVIGWALGTAGALLLTAVAVAIGRRIYLDAVTSAGLQRGAAGVVYDALVRFLRVSVRIAIVVALAAALLAFATGPSRAASGARGLLSGAGGRMSSGRGAPFAHWVGGHRRLLYGAGIGVALGFVAMLDHPGLVTVLVALGVLIVYLGLVTAIGPPRTA